MRKVTYETVRGVGGVSDLHLVRVAPLGGEGMNALDAFKHLIFGLGNATETKKKLKPYSVRRIATNHSTTVPMEMAVHEELSWPFAHVCSVGEDSVTLAFSENAVNYTREAEISTIAANIAALLRATYEGPSEPTQN